MPRIYVRLFIVMGWVLGLGSITSYAQDFTGLTEDFCGGLNETDCALFHSITPPDSAQFEVLGIINANIDSESYNTSIIATGQYQLDTTVLAALQALNNLSPTEQLTYMEQFSDINALFDLLEQATEIADVDVQIAVDLPDALSQGMIPDPFSVNLWLVDGIAYGDFSYFSSLEPSLATTYGIDIADVYREAFAPLLADPQLGAMFDQALETEYTQEDLDALEAAQQEALQMQQALMAEIITITRQADQSINGQTVAVFEMHYDLSSILESTFTEEMIRAQADQQAEILAEIDPSVDSTTMVNELVEVQLQMMAGFQSVLDNVSITYSMHIIPETGYLQQTDMLFSIQLDAATLAQAMSGINGEPMDTAQIAAELGFQQFSLDMLISNKQTGFNQVGTINPPANATLLTTEQLLYGAQP